MKSSQAVHILEAISESVGGKPDGLAVTVAARGGDPFHVLVSTILSLRARDEVTAVITPALLREAPTAQAMAKMDVDRIEDLIRTGSFYKTKARHLHGMARDIVAKHGGLVPDTMEGLLSLKGVGRKSANLVLNLGFDTEAVCVDVHVHRISNRLGLVRTKAPEQTEVALMKLLPRPWWIPVNGVLIAFGRTQCTPIPRCTSCPVRRECGRHGVRR